MMLVLSVAILHGCGENSLAVRETVHQSTHVPKTAETAKIFLQVKIAEKSDDPSIDISEFSLVGENIESRRADAEAVMQIKKKYPLAMRRKDRGLFDQILAKDFTFRGSNDFFDRAEYIDNRVAGEITDWSVKYENIVLQFVGDIALVSYRNVVKGRKENGQPDYTERMTWADVYVKEGGQWKIGAVHLIDYREEVH
jgi:ketosteroid isomerase-like protein